MLLTGTQFLQLAARVRELVRRAGRPGGHAFTIDELRCAYKSLLGRDVAHDALEVLCDALLEHDPKLKVQSNFTRVHAFYDPADAEAIREAIDSLAVLSRGGGGAVKVTQPARLVEVILNEDRDKEVAVFSGELLFRGPAYFGRYGPARTLAHRLEKLGYNLRERSYRAGRRFVPLPGLQPFGRSTYWLDHGMVGRQTYGFYLEPKS